MRNFKTHWKAAIDSRRFDIGLRKLDRLSWKLQNGGNKKVGSRQKSSQNAAMYSFGFGTIVRHNANLTISARYTFFIGK